MLGHGDRGPVLTEVVDGPEEYQAWLKERAELSGSQNAPAPTDRPEGEPAPGGNYQGTVPEPGAPKIPGQI